MKTPYIIFLADLKSMGLQKPVTEHRFAPPRRWRFDFAWPDSKLALEIEGGAWTSGRHVRGTGFTKDMEKYNTAVMLDWQILRVTPQQVNSGYATRLVRDWFAKEK